LTQIKVLLIDDETDFLALMSERLGLRGVEVSTAVSGPDGLRILREKDIDVVLLDMRIPGMDGLAILKEIGESLLPVEVLILTGHADMEAAIRGVELGASDYLVKPVVMNELIFKLEEACQGKKVKAGST